MDKQYIGDLTKQIVLNVKEANRKIEEDDQYIALEQEYELLGDLEESDEVERKKELIELRMDDLFLKKYLDPIFRNIDINEMKEILQSISSKFIEEYNISTGYHLNSTIEYLLDHIPINDYTFFNGLLEKESFTESYSGNERIINNLISKCNDEQVVLKFLENYTNQLHTYDKNSSPINQDNFNFSIFMETVILSNNLSENFRYNILTNEEFLKYINNYCLSNILKSDKFSKEQRRNLLLQSNINKVLSDFYISSVVNSICDSFSDYNEILSNPDLYSKLSFSTLVYDSNLDNNEFEQLLFDNRVFPKLDFADLGHIIAHVNISFDKRKNLIFDDRIYSKLQGTPAFEMIIESNKMTSDQRIELFENDIVFSNLISFGGSISHLFEYNNIPIIDKVKMIKSMKKNNRLQYLSSDSLQKIIQNKKLPKEIQEEIIFDDSFFYIAIDEYNEKYNPKLDLPKGPFKYDKKEYLKRLYENNNNVLKTLLLKLLKDEILDNGFEFVETLSKYPKIAYSICNIYCDNIMYREDVVFFENMLKVIQQSKYKSQMDMRPYISKILDISVDHSWYDDTKNRTRLLSKIRYNLGEARGKQINFTEEQWKVITEIGLRDRSSYYNDISPLVPGAVEKKEINFMLNIFPPVEYVEDLNNFYNKRVNLCNHIFQEAIATRDIEKAKNALFNKYFNINIEEAIEIVRMYGSSIHNFDNNSEYVLQTRYIEEIQKVLDIKNISALEEVYSNFKINLTFDETLYIDQSLRQMFSKEISESVFKINGIITTDENLQISAKTKYLELALEIDGIKTKKRIQIYEPGYDFKMLVHSTAAYGKMDLINDNYYDSWNKSSRKTNHGICCSLISNDNMGMAQINDVLFGFDGWDSKAINKIAPYDIYSSNDDYELQEARKLTFMTAQDIINNTRHTHNEMVLERIELRDDKINKEQPNIQPSYVIMCSDMSDEIKEKAIKCSEEMNIPIVYLDKEKIVKNEVNKINTRIDEFNQTDNLDIRLKLLEEILLIHENNRSGLRASNNTQMELYFPTSKVSNLFEQIITQIKNNYHQSNDINEYYLASTRLMQILDREKDKFDIAMETTERKNFIDIPVEEYEMSLMQNINPELCQRNVPKLETIIDLNIRDDPDSKISQILKMLDRETIHDAIYDAVDKNLYPSNEKNHNVGHIERVILLSQLIGSKELKTESGKLDMHALNLLTECAKYHDCGRTNDTMDKNHGQKSAEMIPQIIEGYSFLDVKIMQVVVEYHESIDDDYKFSKICQKYEIPLESVNFAKKIAICLKDADALDRTRFKNRNATLDEKQLRTESSKNLIPFATQINCSYETIDKKLYSINVQQLLSKRQLECMLKDTKEQMIESKKY